MRILTTSSASFASILFVAILTINGVGCAKLFPQRTVDYRTVAANPHHDTELAREKNEKALRRLEKGDCPGAERILQESLAADVDFGPAHNNLGRLYFQHGKFYLAAWEFEYAARLMPERAEPINNVGLVYETVGKLDQAIAAFEEAHAQSPDHGDYLANLVRARWRRGDRDDETVDLLREVTVRDSRPQWRAWAQEALVFHESRRRPIALPNAAPEEVPLLETVPKPAAAEPKLNLPPLPEPMTGGTRSFR